jgi:hypothetical protein
VSIGRTCVRLACLALAVAGLLAAARAVAEPAARALRRFDFARDTFAYANDLYWSYEPQPDGVAARPRSGPVEFGQRCVGLVRSARQFFHAARFSAGRPLSEAEYRERVRAVLASDPRSDAPAAAPIVIPGFADLRGFSRAHERLLKEELGGPAASYLQRGNWRMILPFSRSGQRSTVEALQGRLAGGGLPVVRVVNFPVIDINHALLVFDADSRGGEIRFRAYDPNDVERPVVLVFDRASARFRFPRTPYFAGGPVNLYEIFTGAFF